jgi:hypothetical protein
MNSNKERSLPGYTPEYKHFNKSAVGSQNIAGGLAIFIKNSINYEVIAVDNPINSAGEVAFEIQAIKIHLTGAPLVLVNIYSRGSD